MILDRLIERSTAIESSSLQLPGNKDGAVSRMAAEKTVQRYNTYVRQKKKLGEIFRTYDTDQSGKLERAEALRMMNEIAARTRSLQHVKANQADLDLLLERTDMDGDVETVSREELLPALVLWKEMAQARAALEGPAEPMRCLRNASGSTISTSFRSTGYDFRKEGLKGSTACAIL